MYKLYILVLKKKGAKSLNDKTGTVWLGFEKEIEAAYKKAEELLPKYKYIWHQEVSFGQLRFLLPWYNVDCDEHV